MVHDVITVATTRFAMTFLRQDGGIYTIGRDEYGGCMSDTTMSNSYCVPDSIKSGIVTSLFSTDMAFAAIMSDGTVDAWGNAQKGGCSNVNNNELEYVLCCCDLMMMLLLTLVPSLRKLQV